MTKQTDFEQQLKESLSNPTSLSQSDLDRLKQSRYAALEKAQNKQFKWPMWSAAIPVAFASVLFFILSPDTTSLPNASPISASLFSTALSSDDEFELYNELDFYEWLEHENS